MKDNVPFARANKMVLALTAAMTLAAGLAPLQRSLHMNDALRDIGPYRSRGRGRGAPSRRYGSRPGKYRPHQGLQECARRVAGGFAEVQNRLGLCKADVVQRVQKMYKPVFA